MTARRQHPSGMTLAEVIVAMSIATALVGIVFALTDKLLTASMASHDHLQDVVVIGRLAEQFRKDAHDALQATQSAEASAVKRLSLQTGPGQSIEYEIVELGVRRGEVTGGNPGRSEDFPLRRLVPLDWNIGSTTPKTVALRLARVARSGGEDQPVGSPWEITALLDRHARQGGDP